jgi:hypothetical protein
MHIAAIHDPNKFDTLRAGRGLEGAGHHIAHLTGHRHE